MKAFVQIACLWIVGSLHLLGRDVPLRPGSPATALDRYIAAPDSSFRWALSNSTPAGDVMVHTLDMVSQSWRSPAEVDHPEWRHWLLVVVPKHVDHPTALLFVTGGRVGAKAPEAARELIEVAKATHSVVAELHQVPSQPLIFGQDGHPRSEDDFIAYTWDKFLRTGDELWPARLPMTKSVVRAMDAITAFCQSPEAGKHPVQSFVVAGASKRGWTTWATAAVDPRVVGICPIVIDVLNQGPSMERHYRAYGTFADSVGDYTQQHIMDWGGTSETAALNAIEDPYSYRGRFTMPKLIMNATGDEYFLPDSSQYYFADLPGPKYLRYVPNANHSLAGSDAYLTILGWHDAIVHHRSLPEFHWRYHPDGSLEVSTLDRPVRVTFWQAFNPGARDFRLETAGPIWKSTPVDPQADGIYVAAAPRPKTGWAGYFMEMVYDLGGPVPLKVTTAVRVIPETLPYPPPRFVNPKGFLHR